MNLVHIEERSGSIFTDFIFSGPDHFIHKQVEYKNQKMYVRVWKRFFKL
ncbi:MAG: hypothetical protein ABIJ21_02400 [Nanoarchaeota archaeon]